ncbi:MAG: hypothetical protein AB7K24_15305 [Gemmataceae bacterium]
MKQSDVTQLMGVPPGNYSGGGYRIYFGLGKEERFDGDEWIGETVAIGVQYTRDNRVKLVCVGEVHDKQKLAFILREWLGLVKPLRIVE